MSETPRPLLIGDLASLIGTSASTLRLWEEHGIVEPEKDERNQYRRYTPHDSCRFLFARKYRSLGVPLGEVTAVMGSGADTRDSVLRDRRAAMDAEIDRLIAARAALDRYMDERRLARSLVGRSEVGERPAAHYFPCVEGGSVRSGGGALARAVLDLLPAVDYVTMLDPTARGPDRSFSCRWGFAVADAAYAALPAGLRARSIFLPTRRCLLTAVVRSSARDFTEDEFRSLMELPKTIGAETDGPVVGHLLEAEGGERAAAYLILLFIPIK